MLAQDIKYFAQLVERAKMIGIDLVAVQQRWTTSMKRFSGKTTSSSHSRKKSRFGPTKFRGRGQSVLVPLGSDRGSIASFGGCN